METEEGTVIMGTTPHSEQIKAQTAQNPCKGMLLLDLDKNGGRVIEVSGAARALVKEEAGEDAKREVSLDISPHTAESLDELMQEATENGTAYSPCLDFRAGEEESLRYSVTLFNLNVDSGEYVLLVLGAPSAGEIFETQYTGERYALMGKLVSQLTHRIFNSLQVVVGRLQLLMEEMDSNNNDDDNIAEPLHKIWSQIEIMRQCFERYHTLFQQGGEEWGQLHIGDIFNEASFFYKYYGAQKQVALVKAIPPYLPILQGKKNELVLSVLSILLRLGEVVHPGTYIAFSAIPVSEEGSNKYLAIKFTTVYNKSQTEAQNFSNIYDNVTLETLVTKSCVDTVRDHGGRLELSSHDDGGIQLSMYLPYDEYSIGSLKEYQDDAGKRKSKGFSS